MTDKKTWFTRRGKIVKGPYPGGLITRYILLGRVRLSDDVSPDGHVWLTVSQVAELIPPILKTDLNDPHNLERLLAAKRWADERTLSRREARPATVQENRDRRWRADRRAPEEPTMISYRKRRFHRAMATTAAEQRRKHLQSLVVIIVAMALGALGYALLVQPPSAPEAMRDCRAAASPGVVWNNCPLEGAQMAQANLVGAQLRNVNFSGADLRASQLNGADISYGTLSLTRLQKAELIGAVLRGASLRGADLQGANLERADLSYADLSGANIVAVNLTGAILDHAVWIDKTICANGSRGKCLSVTPPGRPGAQ